MCDTLKISVAALAELVNPLENPPWYFKHVPDFKAQVANCIVKEVFEPRSYSELNWPEDYFEPTDSVYNHAARVAYLVANPNAAPEPISIDVYVSSRVVPCIVEVLDGNHRLAAAIFRGDDAIATNIGGDVEAARKILEAVI